MLRRILPQKSSSQLAWTPTWDCQNWNGPLPAADGARRGPLARAEVLDGADGLLCLREYAAGDDPQLGSGLKDPHTGLSERQVVPVGPLDQAIQDGIVEVRPPVPVRGGSGADPSVPGLDPAVRYRHCRWLVVRADHASGKEEERRTQEAGRKSPVLLAR